MAVAPREVCYLWGFAMQHPFAGLVETEQKSGVVDPAVSNPTRRGLFGLIAGTIAVGTLGTIGLLGSSNEAEAYVTSNRWGEEGGTRRPLVVGRTRRLSPPQHQHVVERGRRHSPSQHQHLVGRGRRLSPSPSPEEVTTARFGFRHGVRAAH